MKLVEASKIMVEVLDGKVDYSTLIAKVEENWYYCIRLDSFSRRGHKSEQYYRAIEIEEDAENLAAWEVKEIPQNVVIYIAIEE